jgi:ankyrin repeat protein
MNDCLKDSDSETVIALLLADANPNAKDKGRMVLHWAAWHGHLDVINILIEMEANVNAEDGEGLTPLHLAAFNGNLNIVMALIKAGAEVDRKDKRVRSPLYCAINEWNLDTIKALLEAGADVNPNGYGPLHKTASGEHLSVVNMLITAVVK